MPRLEVQVLVGPPGTARGRAGGGTRGTRAGVRLAGVGLHGRKGEGVRRRVGEDAGSVGAAKDGWISEARPVTWSTTYLGRAESRRLSVCAGLCPLKACLGAEVAHRDARRDTPGARREWSSTIFGKRDTEICQQVGTLLPPRD